MVFVVVSLIPFGLAIFRAVWQMNECMMKNKTSKREALVSKHVIIKVCMYEYYRIKMD